MITPSTGIIPYSHPATTAKVLSLLERHDLRGKRILDLGAGEGYLTSKLYALLQEKGENAQKLLSSCDIYPEGFRFDKVACQQADFSSRLPFEDGSFDYIICQEVIEHLPNQEHLIQEVYRLLKPGGRVWITTPNISNFNSRIRSFFTGTMPLFDILPIQEKAYCNGHINPISLYYLYYFAKRTGFLTPHFYTDRIKRSAACFGWPFYALARICKFFHDRKRKNLFYWEENRPASEALYSWEVFTGRTIIMEAKKSQPTY